VTNWKWIRPREDIYYELGNLGDFQDNFSDICILLRKTVATNWNLTIQIFEVGNMIYSTTNDIKLQTNIVTKYPDWDI
jgi:hypothetical protein